MDGSAVITSGRAVEAADMTLLTPLPRAGGTSSSSSSSPSPSPSPSAVNETDASRIRLDGKFFRCGGSKWFVKGLTYGPFTPTERGIFLPPPPRVAADFAQIRDLGGNAVRLYHTPPRWLLDEALSAGLRVMIDVPWEKHRCFLEDDRAQAEARRRVGEAAQLAEHPAVFAISVANEIPKDIVRFYGERRVERFLRELLDVARQGAPECLLTYTNYPSTEFLRPWPIDFFCFNLYLQDPQNLAAYLDRLRHLAGPAPLVLGEHGLDSLRNGEAAQATSLGDQTRCVFGHGLAGSFVFSYTDDWFAGGEQVRDWAFGVTDRQRRPKPAAASLNRVWAEAPHGADDAPLPSVSVVVCSYNGAATLEECLRSLERLNYPDFEVILVDDGSTDDTPAIASRFGSVIYLRQENRGLSAARNAGALRARGQIVAYTDSDCVADEDWLRYLVREMARQEVDVIGGPNVPPPSDCQIARCVAASPGGPSHVMLDDRLAEHVPGCNMAFVRAKLLELGGFDEQFRQAGDDVDICWRFLDAGARIGYASSALVWHHRRSTVRAYFRQQAGYGRAEALLYFKHPHRFNSSGASQWNGIIYGEAPLGFAQLPPVIYHGRFGTELFPAIYRQNRMSAAAMPTQPEWHVVASYLLLLALMYPPLALMSAAMWSLALLAAARAGWGASVVKPSPWWSRPLIATLHLLQPLVRSWHRWKLRVFRRPFPAKRHLSPRLATTVAPHLRGSDGASFDLFWSSARGRGRELLLECTVEAAQEMGWSGDYHCLWESHDLLLLGDNWHTIEIRTATEELGNGNRFTRARARLRMTKLARQLALGVGIAALVACACGSVSSMFTTAAVGALVGARLLQSRILQRRAICELLADGAKRAGLVPVDVMRHLCSTAAAVRTSTSEPADTIATQLPEANAA